MRWRCRAERQAGTVTAEFAVTVPAVLLVLAACLGGLRLGAERLRVVDAAAQVARSAARGDAGAEAAAGRIGATAAVRRAGDLVCADVRLAVPLLGLPVPVSASSCALGPALP